MTPPAMITADQVKVGSELPLLSYDVTSTTVVLGALATRDWRPQHHDYHFATASRTSSSIPPTRRRGSSGTSRTGPDHAAGWDE
jgi:hypothetical protein